MFKYEHYNSLILYSCLLLRCKKKKNISNPSFDLYLIYLQHRPSGTHVCGCRHWKIDFVAQQPSYLQCMKKGGDWGKIQLMESVFSRCRKVLHPGSLWFPQLTISCLPTNSTLSSFLQKKLKKKICTEKWLVDQMWSNMFKAASVKLKAWISSEKSKDYRTQICFEDPPKKERKKDQTFR